ncbi:MAG TPA: NAD(P)/FAD-dependent oxidoreductase [Thermoplasmata archaeon]|nr:NAD(P)/FAD-dependent oxidoreductase [Thermoplasmata archaeon]
MILADAYDVIVIGAGHNGLVAAAYLARAGLHVLVLERRSVVGGAATTEEFHPGFRGLPGATLCGNLRPEVVRDLGLGGHGLQLLPLDPEVVSLGDGRVLRLWRDSHHAAQEIAAFSKRDAAAFPAFQSLLARVAEAVDPLLMKPPPEISEWKWSDQLLLARRALALRRGGKDVLNQAVRMIPMSLRGVLDEWFEDDTLKGTLAADALIGTFRGPYSPETAFGLLHHALPAVHGLAWSMVRGGMGQLTRLLALAAQGSGASIRTDAEVRHILTKDGHTTGVQLASGEILLARVVLSNADPKRTFLHLADPAELPRDFLDSIRHFQTEGIVARVNLALDGPPTIPGTEGAVAHLRVAPSMEYLERAYDDAKYGAVSRKPFLDAVIPTLLDPSLAPTGKHVMSVTVQYAPYHRKTGNWDRERERLGDTVVEVLDEHLPGLGKLVLEHEVLTPVDLERRFGLTDGHIYHGEMTLNQQLVLRPAPGWSRYRTPIEGLYLCGAGAHPGGGVTGAPGHNAAQAVLTDRRTRGA